MKRFWNWLLVGRHRAILGMAGAFLATVIGAGWQLTVHTADAQTSQQGQVNCGVVGGRDISGGTFNLNCGPPPNNDPRHQLADMGIMWGEHGFIDALIHKDNRALSLFLDGGWKSDKLRFYAFSNQYFDPKSATHWTQDNFDAAEACGTPELVDYGSGRKLYVHDKSSSASADVWMYHVPDFYGDIQKYNDPKRVEFIKRVCNVPDVIAKFDEMNNIYNGKKGITSVEKAELSKWNEIKNFLTS